MDALLTNLLSEDNTTRNAAEEELNALNLDVKIPNFVKAIRAPNVPSHVKDLAAVLLRRVLLQKVDELNQIDLTVIRVCRLELLEAIQVEENDSLRHKICDAVAELARASIDDNNVNHWPEILQFLFNCCDVNQPRLYESALHIMRIVPIILLPDLDALLELIQQMLYQALVCQHANVAMASTSAINSIVMSLESQSLRHKLTELLPHMITVLESSIENETDENIFKSFIDVAEHRPRFFRSHLPQLCELMIKIMQTDNLENNWKQLALEFIVTFAENGAVMLRKNEKFHSQLVETCLKFMIQVEDDEEWSTTDDLGEDEDSSSISIAGETGLDRLANALGGKTILPHIIRIIPTMLSSGEWQYRYAALMAVSAIAEGCEKQMISILGDVIDSVLPFCRDSHHRVRYAACNALGQMSTDFSLKIQEKFHDKIIPALLAVFEDFPNPRVQTHAGAALVNFCELCPKDILANYLESIFTKLEVMFKLGLSELIDKGHKLIIEQMVTTLGTVADAAEEHFLPFYDRFMPSLKYLMANANSKDHRLLRGKTIECISFIGVAVGKAKFMQDAHEILQMLFKVQSEQSQWETDDPQVSYMISAWARICKIIGPEFVDYLPYVIGPLIQAASVKPEIAIVDSIEAEQNFSEEDGWEFITLADQQKFGIKTAGLEDKCTAMQMLVVYAKDLKEGFADYATHVSKIMVPHLRFYFHEMVRAAAAEILPYLLECIKPKGPEAIAEMWSYMSEKLLEAIPLELDSEITGLMMNSLSKCIELLGANCFTSEQYSKIVDIIRNILNGCFLKMTTRQDKRQQDEDYDEEVEAELEAEDEDDDYIMRKVTDLIHSLFSTHGSTLLPLFDQLLPIFVDMLTPDKPSSYKQWSLCVFDDVLEFASQSAIKYQECFVQQMVACICDSYAPTRQAAAYGIGVLAEKCNRDFSQVCLDALPSLIMGIQRFTGDEMPVIHARENSISAVAKVCQYVESGVPYDTILPLWLSWLPVIEDKEEAIHVYSYLCDLIERNNVYILGSSNENVPKILGIIGDVISEDVLRGNNQVLQRLLSIVRHVQASGEVWEACLKYLNKKQQVTLLTALQ